MARCVRAAPVVVSLVVVLAIPWRQNFAQSRRLPTDPLQAAGSLSALLVSPLANDLNRTTAHAQPTTSLPARARVQSQPTSQPRTQAPGAPASGSRALETPRNSTAEVGRGRPATGANRLAPQMAAGAGQPNSMMALRAKWRSIEQSLADAHSSASAHLGRTLDELWLVLDEQAQQVSTGCRRSLEELVAGLAEQELWASQMVDASASLGRPPSGSLEGTLTELGNYDECVAISYGRTRHRTGAAREQAAVTRGQYCSVLVKPPLANRPRLHTICRRLPSLAAAMQGAHSSALPPGGTPLRLLAQHSHQFHYAGLRLGVCLPSRCSQADVKQLVQAFLIRHELVGQLKHCQRQDDPPPPPPSNSSASSLLLDNPIFSSISQKFDLTQQCILFTFLCLAILNALGTWLDDDERACALAAASSSASGGISQAVVSEDSGGPRAAAAGKRAQQYRVCRSDFATGSSDDCEESCPTDKESQRRPPLPPPPPLHELKLQRNPLADFAPARIESEAGRETLKPAGRAHAKQSADNLGTLPMFLEREREQMLAGSRNCVGEGGGGHGARSLWREFLVCFSVKRNLRSIGKLAAQPAHTSADSMSDLKVVHGLRTLSMIWIIFGHTIGLVSPEMMNNLFPLASLSCSSRFLQAILNTTLAVDTFFMISGLVTVISFVRKCKSALRLIEPPPTGPLGGHPQTDDVAQPHKLPVLSGLSGSDIEVSSVDSSNSVITSMSSSVSSNKCVGLSSKSSSQKNFIINKTVRTRQLVDEPGWPSDFQPLLWLLMRYLRLTPAYASIIGLSVLLPSLGSGPFWPETAAQLGAACRTNWWTNLLYVNNFIETDKLCLIHSWYLSNDWQFFLLALLLFGLFYKSRKLSLILLVSAFVASSATTFIVTMDHNYPPTIVTTSPAVEERWEFIHSLYYKPWPHMPAYLVGLIVGFLISKLQLARRGRDAGCARPSAPPTSALELAPGSRLACWLLFGLISFAVLNSIYPWNMGLHVDPTLTALHSCTFRTLWAACCAWLVFALVSRPRNPLALLLSWHGFQVTSRLTYCAYLVHPLVIYYHFGTLRERIDSSVYGQLHRFLATLVASYLLAFLVSLLIESPSIQFQRFLVRHFGDAKSRKIDGKVPEAGRHTYQGRRSTDDPEIKPNARAAKSKPGYYRTRSLEPTAGLHGSLEAHSARLDVEQAGQRAALARSRTDRDAMIEALVASQGSLACSVAGHRCPYAVSEQTLTRDPGAVYDLLDGRNSSHGSNNSAVDEEFQRKLAQAIGRGFKIRSRIVNGTPKCQSVPESSGACLKFGHKLSRLAQELPGCEEQAARSRTGELASGSLSSPTSPQFATANRRGTNPLSTFVHVNKLC